MKPTWAIEAAAQRSGGIIPDSQSIVSLAAAMALPAAFPYRDLVVRTAFAVVLGTLVIQD
jgi:Na+-translocating ferredoxin:NAD+ oxidoreductase RnfD subunit